MLPPKKFRFFDPDGEVSVSYGRLPHWDQAGATYFVTFRTADSLPVSVVTQWQNERDDWLRTQGIDPNDKDWHRFFEKLPRRAQARFHEEFSGKLESYLDDCHGRCVLRKPDLARIVASTLLHFDGERYHLGDFIIMPNHAHLLVCLFPEARLKKQCYSWKHYSASGINDALGEKGEFWQRESFDHLVRDEQHFERFRRYIAENPKKAGLKEDEYYYRRCGEDK